MTSALTLTVFADRRPDHVADLARDLVVDLRREHSLEASEVTRAASAGERSAEVSVLGQIALTFLSAGAATALIGCLKSYIDRDRSLRIKLKRSDGTEFELEGKHFDPKTIDETVRALQRLTSE